MQTTDKINQTRHPSIFVPAIESIVSLLETVGTTVREEYLKLTP
jgi:hypothetical protein